MILQGIIIKYWHNYILHMPDAKCVQPMKTQSMRYQKISELTNPCKKFKYSQGHSGMALNLNLFLFRVAQKSSC